MKPSNILIVSMNFKNLKLEILSVHRTKKWHNTCSHLSVVNSEMRIYKPLGREFKQMKLSQINYKNDVCKCSLIEQEAHRP